MTTEQCCETTTRVAHDVYGYEVDFVTEATATFPIGELSPDEIARRTEAGRSEALHPSFFLLPRATVRIRTPRSLSHTNSLVSH